MLLEDLLVERLSKLNPKISLSSSVIAAIFIRLNETTVHLISIGIGTKCLNDSELNDLNSSFLVHDCHAEVLARRSFIRWLVKEMNQVNSPFLKMAGEKFCICGEVLFFISQAPCGDCAVDQLREEKPEFEQNVDAVSTSIVHGHSKLYLQGKQRTKPGRIDSVPTKILSCSDKLASWLHLKPYGLEGKTLGTLFLPIRPTTLLIGRYFNRDSILRGLFGRFNIPIPKDFRLSPSNFVPPFNAYRTVASFWWNCHDGPETIASNGLKQGASIEEVYNEKVQSKLCSNQLESLFKSFRIDNSFSFK